MMDLCTEKIFEVSTSNFLQYIPLYIILKAKKYFDSGNIRNKNLDKTSCCEILFATSFISELIHRSFPKRVTTPKKNKP
jgi:hypothetical protein